MRSGLCYHIELVVHGEHDGVSYNSVWHSIHKLHWFLQVPAIYCPILAVQINL